MYARRAQRGIIEMPLLDSGKEEKHRTIYCCGCGLEIQARLTNGSEIYPHRRDLHELPFWKCDGCRNYVGCHHKTSDRTRPLGIIPTPQIRKARIEVHRVVDALWRGGRFTRRDVYKTISEAIGRHYHSAEIRSIEEAREIYRIAVKISH
jgi:hypothetical protein